jgi:hypothetical protein
MEATSGTSTAVLLNEEVKSDPNLVVFEVKPRKGGGGGVRWSEDTVDNEHLNKKKSKSKIILLSPLYSMLHL